jgi:4-alpha-glucanotransferase
VPPDSFSTTGQRWGNPIHLWERHAGSGYDWWLKRIDAALEMFDILRIDHFRAFHDYWRIPASEPTAINGVWEPGPGKGFFDALGDQRCQHIIAEDLGDKMEGPLKLREEIGLPGMAVLQFMFSGKEEDRERFRADMAAENRVIYTGTHDNTTILGWWYAGAPDDAKQAFLEDTATYEESQPNWAMIQYGMDEYQGHTFIVPMQDIICLGASARMNRPSVEAGNWRWRATSEEFLRLPTGEARQLTEQTKRKRRH